MPIINARVEQFVSDEVDYFTITGGTIDPTTGIPVPNTTTIITEGGQNIIPQPIGRDGVRPGDHDSRGLSQAAQMSPVIDVDWAVVLPILSVTANGTTIISVTCSEPHGLATNAQIAVDGLNSSVACGFFTVVVTTATAFTYAVTPTVAAGSLLMTSSRIVTTNAGLPYDNVQVPLRG